MASPSNSKPSKGSGSTKTAKEASSITKEAGQGDKAPVVPNSRRQDLAVRLFFVSLLVMGIGAFALWKALVSHLDDQMVAWGKPEAPPVVSTGSPGDAAKVKVLEEQITALQKQLDAWRRDQLTSQKELRESIERTASSRSAPVPAAAQPMGGVLDGQARPGVERTAEMVASITPTQAEFIQLKERNRITAYADEAIVTGLRKPLETIVEYIRGSGSPHLSEAAQAEYMRVVRMIQFYQREDPGFRLPVTELFKAENFRNEADLKPTHLFQLLADVKQPWEVRVRAAMLLKGSDAPETNAKLIAAIKEDPSLEVAKHAQIALEQRIQRRFRLLDIPAIDEWVKQQGQ